MSKDNIICMLGPRAITLEMAAKTAFPRGSSISGLCTETSSSGPFGASVSGENPVPDSTRKKSEGAVWRPQSQ